MATPVQTLLAWVAGEFAKQNSEAIQPEALAALVKFGDALIDKELAATFVAGRLVLSTMPDGSVVLQQRSQYGEPLHDVYLRTPAAIPTRTAPSIPPAAGIVAFPVGAPGTENPNLDAQLARMRLSQQCGGVVDASTVPPEQLAAMQEARSKLGLPTP